jgi:Zn-dependent M16 (insulinase) family peptidase
MYVDCMDIWCYIYFQVRNYHKEFYRPENLTLIIAGQVKPDEVFQALTTVEDKIISKVLFWNLTLE